MGGSHGMQGDAGGTDSRSEGSGSTDLNHAGSLTLPEGV